jgi:type IX secretion system PorP/SprF family membrane protein
MKKLVILIFLFAGIYSFAQQDALFSQYMFNQLVINPAYAGTSDVLNFTAVGRKQWVIDGGPKTLTFSVHSPLRYSKVGLGLYCYTDILGPQQSSGVITAYSYKIRVGEKGNLSFGLQVGILHSDIDWSIVKMPDGNDIVYFAQMKKKVIPDANFGLYYYTDKFYVGVSSKHLFEQEFSKQSFNGQTVYGNLLRHFYGMAGVAIPIGDRVVLKPSAMVKYVHNAPVQVDINASVLLFETIWLGVSYRTERQAVAIAELLFGKGFKIGYSYDVFLNELAQYNKGAHEIMIGYELRLFNNRMMTPRYF